MSIIVEGVDGTGKTTFAKEWIVLNDDYFYIHNYVKPKRPDDVTSEMSKEILVLRSSDAILDRSFIISEYVYSRVLGRTEYIDDATLFSYLNYVNTKGHTLVLCTYRDIANIRLKQEDSELPIAELDAVYKDLIINKKLVKLYDVRYIDDYIEE